MCEVSGTLFTSSSTCILSVFTYIRYVALVSEERSIYHWSLCGVSQKKIGAFTRSVHIWPILVSKLPK